MAAKAPKGHLEIPNGKLTRAEILRMFRQYLVELRARLQVCDLPNLTSPTEASAVGFASGKGFRYLRCLAGFQRRFVFRRYHSLD